MADRSLRLKRRLGQLYSNFASKNAGRSVILIYHSVDGGPVSTGLENFRAQMDWLAGHAEVVALDELVEASRKGSGKRGINVALTFDDGYRTVFDTVAPILKAHGFPATVFLNTAEIADENYTLSSPEVGHYPGEEFMLWGEVEQLHKGGWSIGSHGVRHVDLCLCDEEEIERQLTDSKATIENRVGIACQHFSYTWGHHNDVVCKAVKSADYSSAVAGIHAPVVESSDVFELPRLDVRNDYSLGDFVAVVTGKWDYLKFIQSLRSLLR